MEDEIVYRRGKYFIRERKNWWPQPSQANNPFSLYLVYVDGTYWRDVKYPKYASSKLQRCIDWIGARRCFKE